MKWLFDTAAFNVLPDDGPVRSQRCRRLVLLSIIVNLMTVGCIGWLQLQNQSTKEGSRLAEKQTGDFVGR